MSGHTKGTWEVIGHSDDDECRVRQTESVKHGKGFYSEITICEQINRMGNAHLIAAAPDLLEALEVILRKYEAQADYAGIDTDGESVAKANAAIAKARGEA